MKIGFIGLGHMGTAMAHRLLEKEHRVTVYNRTRSKAEAIASEGAAIAETPAAAAEDADVVVSMLADDSAFEEAIFGKQGVVTTLARGRLHVSSSTISPELAQKAASKHQSLGQVYVAAPVLGRPEAAEHGELVVLAAGPDEAIERCRPIFGAIARKTHVVGRSPESANVAKLTVNFVLAAILEVLGEAYALAESHEIDDSTLLSILNDSFLRSPVIGAYGAEIAQRAFKPAGFRLVLGAKDVRLALETAERAGVSMPLGSVLRDRFVAAIANGRGDEDWAAVGRDTQARESRSGYTSLR